MRLRVTPFSTVTEPDSGKGIAAAPSGSHPALWASPKKGMAMRSRLNAKGNQRSVPPALPRRLQYRLR